MCTGDAETKTRVGKVPIWQQRRRHTVEVIKENYAAVINQDLQSNMLPASINLPTLLFGESCAFLKQNKKQTKDDKESLQNTCIYIIYFTIDPKRVCDNNQTSFSTYLLPRDSLSKLKTKLLHCILLSNRDINHLPASWQTWSARRKTHLV